MVQGEGEHERNDSDERADDCTGGDGEGKWAIDGVSFGSSGVGSAT